MAVDHQTYRQIRIAHPDVVSGSAKIYINADASVAAPATVAVAGKAGRREPAPNTSWSDFVNTTPAGVVQILKNGTGQYEITLAGKYLRLLNCVPVLACATNTALALDVTMGADNINTTTAKGSQKLVFYTRNCSTGAVQDPTQVCWISVSFTLKNG